MSRGLSAATTAARRRPSRNAFISIWPTRANCEDCRTVAPWVLTVARNRAIDIARRNERDAVHRAGDDRLDDVPPAGVIAEQVIADDRARHLLSALAKLPDAHREMITLAFYGQLTHTEIAAHLKLPLGTVKGRMRLALTRLRGDIHTSPTDAATPRTRRAERALSRAPACGGHRAPSAEGARHSGCRFYCGRSAWVVEAGRGTDRRGHPR